MSYEKRNNLGSYPAAAACHICMITGTAVFTAAVRSTCLFTLLSQLLCFFFYFTCASSARTQNIVLGCILAFHIYAGGHMILAGICDDRGRYRYITLSNRTWCSLLCVVLLHATGARIDFAAGPIVCSCSSMVTCVPGRRKTVVQQEYVRSVGCPCWHVPCADDFSGCVSMVGGCEC